MEIVSLFFAKNVAFLHLEISSESSALTAD